MLDVGTANALELRRTGSKPAAPAPAVAPSTTPPPQMQPATPPPSHHNRRSLRRKNPPSEAGAAGSFLFDPPALTQAKGATFTVNVMVSGGQNVYSVPLAAQLRRQTSCRSSTFRMEASSRRTDKRLPSSIANDPSTGTLASYGDPSSGRGGRVRPGSGGHADVHGQSAGTIAVNHHARGARDPAMQAIAMSGAQAAVTVQ